MNKILCEFISKNSFLQSTINRFDCFFITVDQKFDGSTFQNFPESDIIIIDENQEDGKKYFILCLNYKLLVLAIDSEFISSISYLNNFLSKQTNSKKYFLKNIRESQKESLANKFFINGIKILSSKFEIRSDKNPTIIEAISNCVSGYLIKKAYINSQINKEQSLNSEFSEIEDESKLNNPIYIKLQNLGNGATSCVNLIYHIKRESIYAMKIPLEQSIELIERERRNLLRVKYPFIVKYYGYIKERHNICLLTEYIKEKTLRQFDLKELDENEKYKIIFELILCIQYIHNEKYIYRDLDPSNIMINDKHDAIIIDFDRLVSFVKQNTFDFNRDSVAPDQPFTCKSDIFSLGYIMFFIFLGKDPRNLTNSEIVFDLSNLKANSKEKILLEKCFNINPDKRPNMIELIDTFYKDFLITNKRKGSKEQYLIELLENNLLKANDAYGYYILGNIYKDGLYVPQNLDKMHHYYSLAADQNNIEAQYKLGEIYSNAKFSQFDINKSIHYFSFPANLNNADAQYKLGEIFSNEQNPQYDIQKAIIYLTLSANQNNADAQYKLGEIFSNEKIPQYNIDKAVNYYNLAANQNNADAQYKLGEIYFIEKSAQYNINKSIHYFNLSASQNNKYAQYKLGLIYSKKNIPQYDINKSIHYFTLSADQNYSKAQVELGNYYSNNKNPQIDINKAIHYYKLAADQNDPDGQYELGQIYSSSSIVPHNINKAIKYYTFAAKQNHIDSNFALGYIYHNGTFVPQDKNKSNKYLYQAVRAYLIKYFKFKSIFPHLVFSFYSYVFKSYQPRNASESIHYIQYLADRNNKESQALLGLNYIKGDIVPKDVKKGIYYFTKSANQNYVVAQRALGNMYYYGNFVTSDIYKSIHYFSLAAEQNDAESQYHLGLIYYEGGYIQRDIQKAIKYFKLSADQNFANAQGYLGYIYYEGRYVPKDIKKAIHYFTLASNQGIKEANMYLSVIYLSGNQAIFDKNKGINYIKRAAYENDKYAQYTLGIMYLNGNELEKNTNKGFYYILQASKNGCVIAHFAMGYLYQFGIYVKPDIQKAIKYYKDASSLNHIAAKNNLGIIYRHGAENEIKKNLGLAVEYFTEAIRKLNNPVIQYNLAHLYFYDLYDQKKEELIELLIQSANKYFYYAHALLCLALIMEVGVDINDIKNKLSESKYATSELTNCIIDMILDENYDDIAVFEEKYNFLHDVEFVYDMNGFYYMLKNVENSKNKEVIKLKGENINSMFYEGFGIKI